jgi:hypothetical protein
MPAPLARYRLHQAPWTSALHYIPGEVRPAGTPEWATSSLSRLGLPDQPPRPKDAIAAQLLHGNGQVRERKQEQVPSRINRNKEATINFRRYAFGWGDMTGIFKHLVVEEPHEQTTSFGGSG